MAKVITFIILALAVVAVVAVSAHWVVGNPAVAGCDQC